MTKNEMTMLLRSVGCDENTITAMGNAYEMGFEQGANVDELLKLLVEEAVSVCNSVDAGGSDQVVTAHFWNLYSQLRNMQ